MNLGTRGQMPQDHDEPGDSIDRAVERVVTRAGAGGGGIAYIEDPAGRRGARLVATAAALAAEGGMAVLTAIGRKTESSYPFGVVIQLFEVIWSSRAPSHSDHAVEGPARQAHELLQGSLALSPDDGPKEWFPVIRSLLWFLCEPDRSDLEDQRGRPCLLVVEDLHHADAPSLRFLAYLAARIGGLPVALVVTAPPFASACDDPALASVREARAARVLVVRDPDALSPDTSEDSRVPDELDAPAEPGVATHSDRARRAIESSDRGGARDQVRELADRAWDSGRLVEEVEDPSLAIRLARALGGVDELELGLEILGDERATAPASEHEALRLGTVEGQAWMLFHQGKITAALKATEIDRAEGTGTVAPCIAAAAAACFIHLGELGRADRILEVLDEPIVIDDRVVPLLLETRGVLRLAQRRPTDALHDALEARRRIVAGAPPLSGPASWRCTAARARHALGDTAAARRVVEEELEIARARDVPRLILAGQRALALVVPREEQISVLSDTVALGQTVPMRLEYVYALIDLGAALRRGNQRKSARRILTQGLSLADQLEMRIAVAKAREELAATAGRRGRRTGTSAPGLTPSQRRVAGLAAEGLSTKQIASELFVTPKTVEFHLHHIYRKLGIPSSRDELVLALRSTTKPPTVERSEANGGPPLVEESPRRRQ
jgi:DNA-binding CsgD family transcriptional regulator